MKTFCAVALAALLLVGCDAKSADACDRLGVAAGFFGNAGFSQTVTTGFDIVPRVVVTNAPVFATGFDFNLDVRSGFDFQTRARQRGLSRGDFGDGLRSALIRHALRQALRSRSSSRIRTSIRIRN